VASLVVQTSFLGDVVLTTPLIAELAGRGPVDVLTTPDGSKILANSPDIRRLIVYDRRNRDRGLGGFARTVRTIRGIEDCDTAYLAQGSWRSALLVTTSGIRRRVGFNTSEGRRLYTELVEYRGDRHHAERLWLLGAGGSGELPARESMTPRLFPSFADEKEAEELLRENLYDVSRQFIVLAPGSAWGTKRWPYYPELAVKAAEHWNVVVVGGPADVEAGNIIVAQLPKGCAANAAGRIGILASAALIGRAAALVSTDSAPQHLASAMDTPTVSVFGPTVPEFGFGPLAHSSVIAGHDSLACRPCDRHGPQRCPLGHWRCMREVSSSEVHDLLTRTLSYRASA
jgi:heptosyltransferase-2